MVTIFTKNECLFFNFGGIDKEIRFAEVFNYHKENTDKQVKIMHPEKGVIFISPKECTIKIENRRFNEYDEHAIDAFINQL